MFLLTQGLVGGLFGVKMEEMDVGSPSLCQLAQISRIPGSRSKLPPKMAKRRRQKELWLCRRFVAVINICLVMLRKADCPP